MLLNNTSSRFTNSLYVTFFVSLPYKYSYTSSTHTHKMIIMSCKRKNNRLVTECFSRNINDSISSKQNVH